MASMAACGSLQKWDEHGMKIGDKMGNLDIDFTDQVVKMQDPLLLIINDICKILILLNITTLMKLLIIF